ncbi:MAG: ParA family protein [Thermoplasmatales archaeon]
MKVISLANQKGGVGKTTVAVNLPVFLAQQHKKNCLVIDLDPQANSTTCLLGSVQENTFEKLLLDDNADINHFIMSTEWGIDLIPSNISAANVELDLLAKYNRDRRLETRLSDLEKDYDFIFIDTPPAVVGLITLNALVASDDIYIVCNTEKFAVDGLVNLMRTIGQIRREYRKEALYFRCILNQFDRRRIIDRDIQSAIDELVGQLLFETPIHENTDISKSMALSKPLYFYNNNCSGYFDFSKLAKEIIETYGKERGKAQKDTATY